MNGDLEEPVVDEALEPPVDALPLPVWSVSGAVGITLLTVSATVAGGFAAAALLALDLDPDVTAAGMGAALAVPYLVVMGMLAGITRTRHLTLAEGVGMRAVSIWKVLPLSIGVALAARLFTGLWGLVLQALGINLPGSNIDPTSLLPSGLVGVVFTVLTACVLAPLAEEMVFRGVLLPAFARRWGDTVGIVVSSAAFAAVHVYPFAMVPIFALAWILARLFLRSRTLWLPILAHSLFNTIGVVAVYVLKAAGRL